MTNKKTTQKKEETAMNTMILTYTCDCGHKGRKEVSEHEAMEDYTTCESCGKETDNSEAYSKASLRKFNRCDICMKKATQRVHKTGHWSCKEHLEILSDPRKIIDFQLGTLKIPESYSERRATGEIKKPGRKRGE